MASGFFNDQQLQADRRLTLNSKVEVRWLNSGYCYRGQGQIIVLNRHEATVALTSASGNYPIGSRIKVPRYQDHTRWSDDSCVIPL